MRVTPPLVVVAVLCVAAMRVRPPVSANATWATEGPGEGELALPAAIYKVTDLGREADGDLVIAGLTYSPDFPTTPDAVDPTCGSDGDAFVLIMSTSGAIRYSTCVGGSTTEYWVGVAPTRDGSVWVATDAAPYVAPPGHWHYAGLRATLWRIIPGVPGYRDVLSVGAPNPDTWAPVVDLGAARDGSIWVLGTAEFADLQTVNAWQPALAGRADMFVGHYARGWPEPLLLTYLGGKGWELSYRLEVAPDGDVVVLGDSTSLDFPVVRPFTSTLAAFGRDFVLVRLDVSGRWLEYSTFLGGTGLEIGNLVALAVDGFGNAYVVGRASSADFPVTDVSIRRNRLLDIFMLSVDGVGRLRFAALVDAGLEAVDASDVSPRVVHVEARNDGAVLVLGSYFSDNTFRAGGFIALTDQRGIALTRPALIQLSQENSSGEAYGMEDASAGPRDVYLVAANLGGTKRFMKRLAVPSFGGDTPPRRRDSSWRLWWPE